VVERVVPTTTNPHVMIAKNDYFILTSSPKEIAAVDVGTKDHDQVGPIGHLQSDLLLSITNFPSAPL